MPVEVRPVRADEAEALADIGLAAWKQGIAPHLPPAVVERVIRDNPFRPFLAQCRDRILAADCDGDLAGLGAREYGDDRITDIWVDPGKAGRGVGTALVRALEDRIRGQGYDRARIRAMTTNSRALGLYRHLGYAATGQVTEYIPELGMEIDLVALERPLGPVDRG